MKKLTYLLLSFLLIIVVACSKQSNIVPTNGSELLAIDYKGENTDYTKRYIYQQDNKIIAIENYFTYRNIKIIYEGQRIKEYETYNTITDDSRKIFRDSIAYNNNGQIEVIYHFSRNRGADLPLESKDVYQYDALNGKVEIRASYFMDDKKPWRTERYFWKGKNIVKKQDFGEDNKLQYEYFFTYDDQHNYLKNDPIEALDPTTGENNILSMDWKDYVGNLELECKPCISEYTYNLDNYPLTIKNNGYGAVNLNITYK